METPFVGVACCSAFSFLGSLVPFAIARNRPWLPAIWFVAFLAIAVGSLACITPVSLAITFISFGLFRDSSALQAYDPQEVLPLAIAVALATALVSCATWIFVKATTAGHAAHEEAAPRPPAA
jgi:hypothetical protein